jgi:hypothetical protein
VKRVLVLNHFAAPPTEPGGTRHVELFSRLEQWDVVILAANRSAMSTRRRSGDASGMYRTVSTTPLSRRSVSRVVNWVSYSVTALLKGATLGRFDVVYGSSPHLLAPLTAWVLARVRRSAFVLEVRDLWPHILAEMGGMSRTSVIYRALTRLEEFLYRRADAIVVMARGVEQELSRPERHGSTGTADRAPAAVRVHRAHWGVRRGPRDCERPRPPRRCSS